MESFKLCPIDLAIWTFLLDVSSDSSEDATGDAQSAFESRLDTFAQSYYDANPFLFASSLQCKQMIELIIPVYPASLRKHQTFGNFAIAPCPSRDAFVASFLIAFNHFPRLVPKVIYDNIMELAPSLEHVVGPNASQELDKIYGKIWLQHSRSDAVVSHIHGLSYLYPSLQEILDGTFSSSNTLVGASQTASGSTSSVTLEIPLVQMKISKGDRNSRSPTRSSTSSISSALIGDAAISLEDAILQALTHARGAGVLDLSEMQLSTIPISQPAKFNWKMHYALIYDGSLLLFQDHKWFLEKGKVLAKSVLPTHMIRFKDLPSPSLTINLENCVTVVDPSFVLKSDGYPFLLIPPTSKNKVYCFRSSSYLEATQWTHTLNCMSACSTVHIPSCPNPSSQAAMSILHVPCLGDYSVDHTHKRYAILDKLQTFERATPKATQDLFGTRSTVEMLRRLIPLRRKSRSKYEKGIKDHLQEWKLKKIEHERLHCLSHLCEAILNQVTNLAATSTPVASPVDASSPFSFSDKALMKRGSGRTSVTSPKSATIKSESRANTSMALTLGSVAEEESPIAASDPELSLHNDS